jgi:hypothetical protein
MISSQFKRSISFHGTPAKAAIAYNGRISGSAQANNRCSFSDQSVSVPVRRRAERNRSRHESARSHLPRPRSVGIGQVVRRDRSRSQASGKNVYTSDLPRRLPRHSGSLSRAYRRLEGRGYLCMSEFPLNEKKPAISGGLVYS